MKLFLPKYNFAGTGKMNCRNTDIYISFFNIANNTLQIPMLQNYQYQYIIIVFCSYFSNQVGEENSWKNVFILFYI